MNLTIESAKAIREEYRENDPTDCYGHQRLAKAVGFIKCWEQRQSEVEGLEKERERIQAERDKAEGYLIETSRELAALKVQVGALATWTTRLVGWFQASKLHLDASMPEHLQPWPIVRKVEETLAPFQKPQGEAGKP